VCLAATVGLALWCADLNADALRVTSGKVSVTCPLTVGGSFEAKADAVTGEVTLGPAPEMPLSGELAVDLKTLATGIGLRDRHLKDNYLEVGRGTAFAAARLQEIRVQALQGTTAFSGVLMLHGERREVTGSATIRPNGAGYRVEATFPVRISEFEIPDPTYLGVGVKNEVQVRVNFTVAPATTSARR
jgi:polyisoprenoid-binding protein YceI